MKVLSVTTFNDSDSVVVWNNSKELGTKRSFWIFNTKKQALDFLKTEKISNKKQAVEKVINA